MIPHQNNSTLTVHQDHGCWIWHDLSRDIIIETMAGYLRIPTDHNQPLTPITQGSEVNSCAALYLVSQVNVWCVIPGILAMHTCVSGVI